MPAAAGPSIHDTRIGYNSAKMGGAGLAILGLGSVSNITACMVVHNVVKGPGYTGGGALISSSAGGIFTGVTLQNNRAQGGGGGLSIIFSATPAIVGCHIARNVVPTPGYPGGGVSLGSGQP